MCIDCYKLLYQLKIWILKVCLMWQWVKWVKWLLGLPGSHTRLVATRLSISFLLMCTERQQMMVPIIGSFPCLWETQMDVLDPQAGPVTLFVAAWV